MSVYQPYSVYSNDGFQGSQEVYQPFQTPPIAPTSSPFADDQTAVGETAMPQSANPPSSLPPSAFINESQSSAYFTASPPWTSAGMSTPLYFPHDQPVPQQMPELGYESASPSSEAAAYSRITLSESPLPKCEASDPYITDHRPVGAGDADNNDPCYADLLRQCLLGAPNYTMSLRDLYGWVAEHSPKARDPTSTGWKNSVRHNLSMNQVCVNNTNVRKRLETNTCRVSRKLSRMANHLTRAPRIAASGDSPRKLQSMASNPPHATASAMESANPNVVTVTGALTTNVSDLERKGVRLLAGWQVIEQQQPMLVPQFCNLMATVVTAKSHTQLVCSLARHLLHVHNMRHPSRYQLTRTT